MTYTLRSEGRRPLTVNEVAKMHRFAWAARTAEDRSIWWAIANDAKVPRLECVEITVTPLHKNRSAPQDVAACAPEAKAAIDGLRDAGVLADDTADIVRRIIFHPPQVCGVNGLELTITEVTP